MYWKVPRLIVKKTNRLTQAVDFFRRHFCAERCCVFVHRQSVRSIYTCTTGMPAEPFLRSILSQRILTSLSGSRLRFFYRDANSVSTINSTPFFYSSINRLYAQNPVFEIVREESVKVYLHMHNGNVQNPVSLKKFPSLPSSRQRCLIPMQIHYSYEHTFVQQ